MASPRLILVPPPQGLVARGYPIHPLAGNPPRQHAGNIPVAPDLSALRRHLAVIRKASLDQGYWVTDEAFVPPSPARIIDFDFVLHAVVFCWLQRLTNGNPSDAVDLCLEVLPASKSSPLKLQMMDNEAKAFTPGPLWPMTVEKKMVDRTRQLSEAGFFRLEHDFARVGGAGYLLQPTQAGLARAQWVSDLTGVPLPGLS